MLQNLALAALYLAAAAAVDPRGEFPLNDDWSYSRTAFRFARDWRLEVDPWSAPSLIGQALYGGTLAKIFGERFLVLRLSTLALALGLALFVALLLRRLDAPPALAAVVLAAWLFNPIQFVLSLTFMTEIPFLFCVGGALAAFARYTERPRPAMLAAAGIALGAGYLVRQTAALFLAALAAAVVLERSAGALRRAAMLVSAAAPLIAAYHVWAHLSGGATAAARRKWELLGALSIEQLVGNFFGALFYLGFFLLPVAIVLAPAALELWRRASPPRRRAAAGFALGAAGFGLAWFHLRYGAEPYLPSKAFHGRMPYLLNVLYDTGLGPLTLDPTYYQTPPTPTYPRVWLALTLASAASVVLLILVAVLAAARARIVALPPGRRTLGAACALSFVLVLGFEVVMSHLQEGGLFDRHLLTALVPLVPLVAIAGRAAPRPGRGSLAAAAAMLALAGWFSIASTHDYFAWHRARWDLGEELLARGVDPLTVAGGFEWNAWHNYDTFRARGGVERIFTWWHDDRRYLVAMRPEAGYTIEATREFSSWVHRVRIAVYLLRREPSEVR